MTVVPFWAVWPFETMVIAKRHLTGMDELNDAERDGLAEILRRTTARYDRVFQAPLPVLDGIPPAAHRRRQRTRSFIFMPHFYPPLLRSATVRKFLVGYEMLGRPAAGHHTGGRGGALAAGLVYSVSTFSKKTPWNWPGFSPAGDFQLSRCSTSGAMSRDVGVEADEVAAVRRAPRRTPS